MKKSQRSEFKKEDGVMKAKPMYDTHVTMFAKRPTSPRGRSKSLGDINTARVDFELYLLLYMQKHVANRKTDRYSTHMRSRAEFHTKCFFEGAKGFSFLSKPKPKVEPYAFMPPRND